MKNLYYLLKRNTDDGKPAYHQWLRSGLIGRGRGFSESSDPDFAFRTKDPIEILIHYEYLRTEIQSPYEWQLVAYMMDDAQRSWLMIVQLLNTKTYFRPPKILRFGNTV